jgi:hypothetical protein
MCYELFFYPLILTPAFLTSHFSSRFTNPYPLIPNPAFFALIVSRSSAKSHNPIPVEIEISATLNAGQ